MYKLSLIFVIIGLLWMPAGVIAQTDGEVTAADCETLVEEQGITFSEEQIQVQQEQVTELVAQFQTLQSFQAAATQQLGQVGVPYYSYQPDLYRYFEERSALLAEQNAILSSGEPLTEADFQRLAEIDALLAASNPLTENADLVYLDELGVLLDEWLVLLETDPGLALESFGTIIESMVALSQYPIIQTLIEQTDLLNIILECEPLFSGVGSDTGSGDN